MDTISPKAETVSAVAKDCMRRCDNDLSAAAAMLEKRARKSGELYRNLMDTLVAQACWAACTLVMRNDRSETKRGAFHKKQIGSIEGMRETAIKEIHGWLAYQISGGDLLADATAKRLRDEIDNHKRLAASNKRQATFYERIVAKIGRKRVRDVFTSEQLDELFQSL